jgi:octaprenyl-diphosphate synthase
MLRTTLPTLSQIQHPIRDRLDGVLDELRRIVFSDYQLIGEINDHLLWSRGKLFRPTLLLLANQIGDRPHPQATTLAAVVELTHLATLVHDDAVDHSVLRRGMPTVNALWNHQTAVIMGDYLYSRSITELTRFDRVDLLRVLSRAANEMSVGELRQLASCDALRFTEADYDRLIESKTASLMAAACEMGAVAGDEALREPLRRYGHALGMAFQIADDLLDYTASEDVTGKPAGQDLHEHKVTLPLIHALGRFDDAERAEVDAFFADPEPDPDGIRRIVEMVTARGGLEYARSRAREFGDRAADALHALPECAAVDALRDAITYVIDRHN